MTAFSPDAVEIGKEYFTPAVMQHKDEPYMIVSYVLHRSYILDVSLKTILEKIGWDCTGPSGTPAPGGPYHSAVTIHRTKLFVVIERTFARDV